MKYFLVEIFNERSNDFDLFIKTNYEIKKLKRRLNYNLLQCKDVIF